MDGLNRPVYPEGTPLSTFIKTGDLIFIAGNSWISRVIKRVTFGKINHVQIVIGAAVFETDAHLGKSGYSKLLEKAVKNHVIIRPAFLTTPQREELVKNCDRYNNIPYDYWDVFLNLLFSPLKDEWRARLVSALGTKKLMKCDELCMRLLYEVSLRKELKWYEGHTPQSFLNTILNYPLDYQILYWNL